MTQNFSISSLGHIYSDPYKAFMWYEDDEGYEKYGFLYSSSISGCLTQIEEYLQDEDFEIDIHVGDKYGGPHIIENKEDLATAKLYYKDFANQA